MLVSVVICTLNRAEGLRATLRCLHQQRWADMEVVVVNGPSTDHSESVIDEFRHLIKARRCPEANLSMSRNIGIRAASGDIVAFIDDDALPEFEWLQQAVPAFADREVAGVGGIVFDHTGMALQYRYSCANRFAEASTSDVAPFDDLCVPGAFTFPYLQGTNALFRRDVLNEVGGFDETYEYYLDETDLCCRIVDAGYVLRQLPHAPVHHKFLPSGIRNHERVVTNWTPIVKNHVYFSYRHALGSFNELDIIDRSRAFVDSRLRDALHHEEAGRLEPGAADAARSTCGTALARGIELGRLRQGLVLPTLVPEAAPFMTFPTNVADAPLRFVFVCADFAPRITGGIARFFSDLAPALSQLGHEVRVITRAQAHGTVDLEDGVWVHRIATPQAGEAGQAPETFPHINDFVTAAALELERIGSWAPIDVVYGPVWDLDVLGALDGTPLPVIAMLATPAAVALADHVGDPAIATLMRLERHIFSDSDLVHANSSAVLETIAKNYASPIDPARATVIPLGLPDVPAPADTDKLAEFEVLFVGRLEQRKGISELLDAIAVLAPRFPHVGFVLAGADTPRPDGRSMIGEAWRSKNAAESWIDRVHFLGRVDDQELHQLYSRADLVVLPSRYESFGLVMAEALMHGRPLITCRTGGIVEFVEHDVNGWLVSPGDGEQLCEAIELLVNDSTLRDRLARAGRPSYEELLSIDKCARHFAHAARSLTMLSCGGGDFELLGPTQHTPIPGGHVGTVLGAGAAIRLPAEKGGLVRIPVRAIETSSIVLRGPHSEIELDVEPGRWARIDASPYMPQGTLEVVRGKVVVAPGIHLDGERT